MDVNEDETKYDSTSICSSKSNKIENDVDGIDSNGTYALDLVVLNMNDTKLVIPQDYNLCVLYYTTVVYKAVKENNYDEKYKNIPDSTICRIIVHFMFGTQWPLFAQILLLNNKKEVLRKRAQKEIELQRMRMNGASDADNNINDDNNQKSSKAKPEIVDYDTDAFEQVFGAEYCKNPLTIYPYTTIFECLEKIAQESASPKSIMIKRRRNREIERSFYKIKKHSILDSFKLPRKRPRHPIKIRGQVAIYDSRLGLFHDQMAIELVEKFGQDVNEIGNQVNKKKYLYIKSQTGKVILMDFNHKATIIEIKEFIHKKEGWPMRSIRLRWSSNELVGNNTLSTYGIGPETTIELLFRYH